MFEPRSSRSAEGHRAYKWQVLDPKVYSVRKQTLLDNFLLEILFPVISLRAGSLSPYAQHLVSEKVHIALMQGTQT